MASIRKAGIKDVPAILEMAHGFHSYAIEDKGLGYSEEDFGRYILFMSSNPNTNVLVAKLGGAVIGSIAGIVSPWFMDFEQLILTEQWWWVNPGNRDTGVAKSLLQHLINWGKMKGCTRLIMMSIGSEEEDKVKGYYGKKGFTYMESHFVKEI